jgi:hypothetical protein
LVDWLLDVLIDWWMSWLTDWLIDSLIDSLIDWLIDCISATRMKIERGQWACTRIQDKFNLYETDGSNVIMTRSYERSTCILNMTADPFWKNIFLFNTAKATKCLFLNKTTSRYFNYTMVSVMLINL